VALPQQNRLRSSRDFDRVHRKGARAATEHLAIRALKDRALRDNTKVVLTQKSSKHTGSEQAEALRLNELDFNALGLDSGTPVLKRYSQGQSKLSDSSSNRLSKLGSEADNKSNNKESADGSPSALSSCFGISISRKVSKRAVVRNRIKRQLKAIIRRYLPDISPGWRVVIVVRSSAVECEFDDFLRELEYLLKKLNVLA
jgi:ribonuclease P protein component